MECRDFGGPRLLLARATLIIGVALVMSSLTANAAVELVGELEIQLAEDFASGLVTPYASIRTDQGRFDLSIPGGVPSLAAGTRVRATGSLTGSTLEVESLRAEPDQSVATPSPSGTLGEQRVLVTLVNFTNNPSEPHTVGDLEWAILDEDNPDSTASYYREASYERTWFTGSVTGLA